MPLLYIFQQNIGSIFYIFIFTATQTLLPWATDGHNGVPSYGSSSSQGIQSYGWCVSITEDLVIKSYNRYGITLLMTGGIELLEPGETMRALSSPGTVLMSCC